MKKIILLCFSLFTLSSQLLAQNWLWGSEAVPKSSFSYGDPNTDHSTAVDRAGNVFITGTFWDTISFGPYTLLDNGNGSTYLVKYNSGSGIIWAKQSVNPGGIANSNSIGIADNGDIYITGYIFDSATFGAITLITNSVPCAFIVKCDSNGSVIWARQSIAGVSGHSEAVSLALDKSGNAFITGFFSDTISFGALTLTANPTNYSTFLVKYDVNGNAVWAKQGVGPCFTNDAMAYSVTADKQGNAYITGYFDDTISFGAFTLKTTNGFTNDVFLVKYNSSGNVIWAKQSTNPSKSSEGIGFSVSIDVLGNSYVTGLFVDTIYFGHDTLIENNIDGSCFLIKYDSNGNVRWAEQGKDSYNNFWNGYSVACDTTVQCGGFLVLSGFDYLHINNFNLKINSETFNLATSYNSATILLHFDSSGKALCGTIFTEGNEDDGDGVGVDKSGKYVYLAGDLFNPAVFGANNLIYGADMPFVARWQNCTVDAGINPLEEQSANVILYPNPSNGLFQLGISNYQLGVESTVEVYNMLGEKVYSETFNIKHLTLNIDLGTKSPGIYLYRVIANTGELIGEGKLVIQK